MSHPTEGVGTGPVGPPSESLSAGTLVAGCLAVLTAQVGLVLPAPINGLIQTSLHTTGAQLTWVTDAFILPTAILELTFGVVGDLFGRKRMLVGGAVAMTVGGLVSGTAHDVHVLWAGQVIAGIGAAALFTSSLAVIAAGTPQPRNRARALAAWTASLSTGAVAAPLISGVVGEHVSFRWAFVALAIVAGVSALVSLLGCQDSSAPQGRGLDWTGQVTIAVALFALLYGVVEGPTTGWSSARIVVFFVVAALGLVAFLAAERRASSPMLRLDLFRIPAFSAAAVVAVIGMFGFLGSGYALSIRVGAIQHLSTLRAALFFVVIQGVTPVVGFGLARVLESISPRWSLVAGLLALSAGQFWLASLPISATSLTTAIGALICEGAGFALIVASISAAAVNAAPIRLAGMASATTSLLREFGQTLGPAVIGAVALSRAGVTFGHRLAAMHLSAAQSSAVAAAVRGGGPLAVLSSPPHSPVTAAAPAAVAALGHGFAIGQVVTGVASVAAAIVAALFLRDRVGQTSPAPEGRLVGGNEGG
jgi:MFS family permease